MVDLKHSPVIVEGIKNELRQPNEFKSPRQTGDQGSASIEADQAPSAEGF
jgi:hypothetical protein